MESLGKGGEKAKELASSNYLRDREMWAGDRPSMQSAKRKKELESELEGYFLNALRTESAPH